MKNDSIIAILASAMLTVGLIVSGDSITSTGRVAAIISYGVIILYLVFNNTKVLSK